MASGCISCAINEVGDPVECLECAANLILDNNTNECNWNECAEWTNEDEYFYSLPVASCNVCIDTYGLFYSLDGLNNTCVPCFKNIAAGELWQECDDCTIGNDGNPTDCLSCGTGSLVEYF